MNIHPIVVHFPIALLIVYTGIEFVSLVVPKRRDRLYIAKLICLWGGSLGTFAALTSGEAAQHYLGMRSNLVHTHEERGEKAHITYMILTIYYLVRTLYINKIAARYWTPLTKRYESQITGFFSSKWIAILIVIVSIVGVGLLTIVGSLGGAISRGTGSGDPVSDWVVATFVK